MDKITDVAWVSSFCAEKALTFLTKVEYISNKVLKSSLKQYDGRDAIESCDFLYLYAPSKDRCLSQCYEVVVRPDFFGLETVYSVYRTDDYVLGNIMFDIFKKTELSVYLHYTKNFDSAEKIQRVCDAMIENPGCRVGLIGVMIGDHEALKNSEIKRTLFFTDPVKTLTPLLIAAQYDRQLIMTELVQHPICFGIFDINRDSVFHHVARAGNLKMFEIVEPHIKPSTINYVNKHGESTFAVALKRRDINMIHTLVLADIDLNSACQNFTWTRKGHTSCPRILGLFMRNLCKYDMQFGGNPLHWCLNPFATRLFVHRKCWINGLNFQSRTPLHMMVIRNRIDCIITLLTLRANPNIQDCNGDTPMHIAIRNKFVSAMQALIAFDVRLDIKNKCGAIARHLIRGCDEKHLLYYLSGINAPRCSIGMQGCSRGCHHYGNYSGEPPLEVEIPPTYTSLLDPVMNERSIIKSNIKHSTYKGGRLLSLDGGGIRGILLSVILLELEKYTRKPIKECFDWIAGSSTGGILALGILAGKTVYECYYTYLKLKDCCFVGIRPYASDTLERMLKYMYGKNSKMTTFKKPKVLITSCLADKSPVELHWFRNYPCPNDILGVERPASKRFKKPVRDEDVYMWEAGRATGAAPTYFRSWGNYIDGGVLANNPTLDALTEIRQYNTALKYKNRYSEVQEVKFVLSIGTGITTVEVLKHVDLCVPKSFPAISRVANSIYNLANILCDQLTESNGQQIDRCKAWCSQAGIPYFRLNPILSTSVSMNETDGKKLVQAIWETKIYLRKNKKILKEIAELINR